MRSPKYLTRGHTYIPTYIHTYIPTNLPTYLPTYIQVVLCQDLRGGLEPAVAMRKSAQAWLER